MRTPLTFTVVVACLLGSLSARPALPIEQAATLAAQDLRERGLADRVFIQGLTLEITSLSRRNDAYWYARYGQSLQGEGQKVELGLRINMDGSVVRLVEGPASSEPLRKSHRTRSDRPSILDLKH